MQETAAVVRKGGGGSGDMLFYRQQEIVLSWAVRLLRGNNTGRSGIIGSRIHVRTPVGIPPEQPPEEMYFLFS